MQMYELTCYNKWTVSLLSYSSLSPSLPQCNNPMTKEPKLTSAVRIIDEWVDYDNEIKRLQKETMTETSLPTSPSLTHTPSHQEL